jgi:hypothetical protein
MILWGTTKRKLKEGQIAQDTCPICESRTTMRYDVFGTYLHIFWIPTIPVRKTKVLECDTCGEFSFLNEFSKRFQDKFKTEVSTPYPIWFFSGLALAIVCIYALIVLLSDRGVIDQNYIDTPQIGDVYTIKVDQPKEHSNDYSSYYTVMKVTKVTKDSLEVMLNTETVKKSYTYYLIDKPEHYNLKLIKRFSKEQLQSLYKTNYIKAVNRQKP